MEVEIRPPQPGDIDLLLADLRAADLAELRATSRLPPRQLIEASVRCSTHAWTATVDGRLANMFGVTPVNMLDGRGSPWMLGTNALPPAARILMRLTPDYIRTMLRTFPILANHVHAENHASVRWLRRMGFTLHAPEPYGVGGALFHPFEMRTQPCA